MWVVRVDQVGGGEVVLWRSLTATGMVGMQLA